MKDALSIACFSKGGITYEYLINLPYSEFEQCHKMGQDLIKEHNKAIEEATKK